MSGHLRGLQHGESLEKYIDRAIRPPSDFVEAMKNAVDQLVRYLHQLPNYSIQEIVLSGSLGKGTTVEQTADADLVVFFNGYRNMESLVENKPKILRDIDQYMRDPNPSFWSWLRPSPPSWMNSIKVIRRTGFHIEYEIGVPYKGVNHPVHVDILPAMDIIALRGSMTSVYDEMKTKRKGIQAHYSACFCKAQKELLRPTPAKVKDLIRLLKHWKNYKNVPMKSYCCEVLALYVFKEELGSKTRFDMKTGFKCALNLLRNFDGITLTITSFYDANVWASLFPKDAFIMDPVNPFSNLPVWDISRIKSIAERTMYALDNVPEDCLQKPGASLIIVGIGVAVMVARRLLEVTWRLR